MTAITPAPATPLETGLWRSFGSVLAISFRASPVMTVLLLLLEPLSRAGQVVQAVALGWLAAAVAAGQADRVTPLGIIVAAAFGGLVLLFLVGFNARRVASEKVSHFVDVEIARLTASIPSIEHLERPQYLDRIEQLRRDPQGIGDVINALVFAVADFTAATSALVVLVVIHPLLAAMPLSALLGLVVTARAQGHWRAHDDAVAPTQRRQRHLLQMATDAAVAKELRVFGLRGIVAARHHDALSELERARLSVHRREQMEQAAAAATQTAVWMTAVAGVAMLALNGGADIADVVIVLTLGGTLGRSLTSFVGSVRWVANNLRTAERFLWLRSYAASQVSARPPVTAPTRLTEGIGLRGVSFTYPGTETPVLSDLSIDLPAGSTVALVGDNGAGKTTLAKLLARFYDPTDGAVEVDGIDLRHLDPEVWRRRLAGAFQDHLHLELLARETIGVGDLDRLDDDAAVLTAAGRGGATDVLDQLATGLDTQLGRRWGGEELSGGQWQKLALARGLMRDEPLLTILDEPTSAIDAVTEYELFTRMAAAAQDRRNRGAVTLLVSHRFSTVRHADLIVVLDCGRIVEHGSHAELLAAGGLYAELFCIQADAYGTPLAGPAADPS